VRIEVVGEKNGKDLFANTAFAFRGYNVTNLGKSPQLLAHKVYGPTVERYLVRASDTASEVAGRKIDLVERVRKANDTTLESYDEAVAMIVAMELAQIDLLEQFFDVEYKKASLSFGYSLGEISALIASGVFEMEDALKIPLSLTEDCVELSGDVSMGVVFSRGDELPVADINRLCLRINHEGKGVIGVSSYLSPNTLLLMGQQDSIERFKSQMGDTMPRGVHLRRNDNRWPPLHTPIVWERHIPDRANILMHTLDGGFTAPEPPVLSLVTGETSYNDYNARELIARWVDHPQRLWDVVYETLSRGIETVVHVGPEPNLIPATFQRLADNVDVQTRGSIHMRTLSTMVRRPWLQRMLPSRAALLRAPIVNHIMLEDWLLEQEVSS